MTAVSSDLESQLIDLKQSAQETIVAADTLEALEKLRIQYLGKKGEVSIILGSMGTLSPDDRPRMGNLANEVKTIIQTALDTKKTKLQAAELEAQLESETLDVTMPGYGRPLGHKHPLSSTIDRILDIFVGLGYTVEEGLEIEEDYYNFEALNTPADHPARDMQDTFYLPDGRLLRTHTSSVQIHYMEDNDPAGLS